MTLDEWIKYYIEESSIRIQKDIAEEEKKIERYGEKIKEIKSSRGIKKDIKEQEVNKLNREIRYVRSSISSLRNINITEEYIKNFIKTHKQIEEFRVDEDGTLNLFTKMLRDGSDFIGAFRIAIRPNHDYRTYNLTYRFGNQDCDDPEDDDDDEEGNGLVYQHWAILQGVPCLGAYHVGLWKAFRRGDLKGFFENTVYHIIMSGDSNAYCQKDHWYDTKRKMPLNLRNALYEYPIGKIQRMLGNNYISAPYPNPNRSGPNVESITEGATIPNSVADFDPF